MDSPLANRTPPTVPAPALRVEELTRVYGSGSGAVPALRRVSLRFARGSFTAVMGPSGSGKSTLLHCSAGLDRPDSGTVHLGELELTRLSERRLTVVRRERVGFVFQSFNLVSSLTARENVVLPLRLAGKRPDDEWVRWLVERVGIAHRLRNRPSQLSGGEQQRVAIARALVTRPEVVFADEPTGALDLKTGQEILELLRRAGEALTQTVVMVTHDPRAAAFADRAVLLADGRVSEQIERPNAEWIAARIAHLDRV